MRFQRFQRYEAFQWTPRSLVMAASRQTRDETKIQKRYPLIAQQMQAARDPFDADKELQLRNARAQSSDLRMRQLQAKHWRNARSDYFKATPEVQAAIRLDWQNWRGPLRPLYYQYVVDLHTGVVQQRRDKFKQEQLQLQQRLLEQSLMQPMLF